MVVVWTAIFVCAAWGLSRHGRVQPRGWTDRQQVRRVWVRVLTAGVVAGVLGGIYDKLWVMPAGLLVAIAVDFLIVATHDRRGPSSTTR